MHELLLHHKFTIGSSYKVPWTVHICEMMYIEYIFLDRVCKLLHDVYSFLPVSPCAHVRLVSVVLCACAGHVTVLVAPPGGLSCLSGPRMPLGIVIVQVASQRQFTLSPYTRYHMEGECGQSPFGHNYML